jgi:hypothetical protein
MNERIQQLADEAVNSIPDHVDFDIPDIFKQKFAELIVADYAQQQVQAMLSNPAYARAMDEYYENKWSHRFD